MESLLFVYGTLRRVEPAAHLLDGADFAGSAHIRGRVIQRDGYPGLVDGPVGDDELTPGELFRVPDEMFERLDRYEGSGYKRKLSEVVFGGQSVTAWVYWLLS